MKKNDLINYINKVLVFYSPKKAVYWNTITKCNVNIKPDSLGKYYLDFSTKADFPGKFSNEGIPLYSHFGTPPIEHPIVIAQYALGLFELLYKKNFNDNDLKSKFLRNVNWFKKNNISCCGGSAWLVKYIIPEYGLVKPWISALAQGETISVLSRASIISNDDEYIELAIAALAPFRFTVKDGGLVNYFKGIPIYEEYPSPLKTVGVLNGFIFSLFGIYDLLLLNINSNSKLLFDQGIDSLKKILHYYDLNFWSRYYLFDYPQKYTASFTYHMIMTEQLKVLYFITGEGIFIKYSDKWMEYSKSFIKKNRALIQKIIYAKKI